MYLYKAWYPQNTNMLYIQRQRCHFKWTYFYAEDQIKTLLPIPMKFCYTVYPQKSSNDLRHFMSFLRVLRSSLLSSRLEIQKYRLSSSTGLEFKQGRMHTERKKNIFCMLKYFKNGFFCCCCLSKEFDHIASSSFDKCWDLVSTCRAISVIAITICAGYFAIIFDL